MTYLGSAFYKQCVHLYFHSRKVVCSPVAARVEQCTHPDFLEGFVSPGLPETWAGATAPSSSGNKSQFQLHTREYPRGHISIKPCCLSSSRVSSCAHCQEQDMALYGLWQLELPKNGNSLLPVSEDFSWSAPAMLLTSCPSSWSQLQERRNNSPLGTSALTWQDTQGRGGTGTPTRAQDGAGTGLGEPSLRGCSRWCSSDFPGWIWTPKHPHICLIQCNKGCGWAAAGFTAWSWRNLARFQAVTCPASAQVYLHHCTERLFPRDISHPLTPCGHKADLCHSHQLEPEGFNLIAKKKKK